MRIEIQIPRLGWSMEEGIFSGWLKKDGDIIKSGEPLFVLEGEKASQEIESTDAGKLHIPKDSPQAGDTVKVGQVIGFLIAENAKVDSASAPMASPPAPEVPPQSAPSMNPEEVSAIDASPFPPVDGSRGLSQQSISPRARRLAERLNVDTGRLTGSGKSGRITEADVLKAVDGEAKTATTEAPALTGIATAVSTIRRTIAERTTLSFSQIPHFYLRAEADVTELVTLRGHLVDVLEKECGVRVTLTDFLLRAHAVALHKFPAANAVWQNGAVVQYDDSDIGIVVSLPDGLVIPVIRAVQKLSFVQIAKERARLVAEVKSGRFNAEITTGGASSISNLGASRTDDFSAIIAPHQSSMLAVGRAAPRPYVVNGNVEVRTTLKLSLSVDHRVLDGAPAAEFLGEIVELLENPKHLVEAV